MCKDMIENRYIFFLGHVLIMVCAFEVYQHIHASVIPHFS